MMRWLMSGATRTGLIDDLRVCVVSANSPLYRFLRGRAQRLCGSCPLSA